MNVARFPGFLVGVLSFVILAGIPSAAAADGGMWVERPDPMPHVTPRPPDPRPAPEPLSVKYHHVDVKIRSQVAETVVDQVFKNDNPEVLEGTYFFPIPESASIKEFSMMVDGKKQTAELLEAEKARRFYEESVARRKDPALLEYFGRNLFRARVYPIEANSEKKIGIAYSELLGLESGLLRYRYPLNTEKFSSKPLESCVINVNVETDLPIRSVYSPTHKVDFVKKGEKSGVVSFEERGVKPDHDFVLFIAVNESDFDLSVVTHKPSGEDGYFMMLMSKRPGAESKPVPRKIVFVIDTSGSMNQEEKMVQAKKALKQCVEGLRNEDAFGVLAFATDVRAFKKELLPATEAARKEAAAWIEDQKAVGATNIENALKQGFRMLGAEDGKRTSVPSYMVFLTDGQPTVDETDPRKIVEKAVFANGGRARVFAFGVGTDLNTLLLDRLTRETQGITEYVTPGENLDVKVSNFWGKVSNPVLTGVSIDYGAKIQVDRHYPAAIPDLFAGSQLTLLGRYRGSGNTVISVKGKAGDQTADLKNDAKFPESESGSEFLPRLWATRRIGYLLEEIKLRGENAELKGEVVELAKKHGIMTPYTSFLVQETRGRAHVPGTRQPGRPDPEPDMPLGVDAFSARLGTGGSEKMKEARRDVAERAAAMAAPSAPGALSAEAGDNAVMMSKAVGKMQREETLSGTVLPMDTLKVVSNRAFRLENETWVEASIEGKPASATVKFGSELFFALLKKLPDLGPVLSLGGAIRFALGDKVIEIQPAAGLEFATDLDKVL